MSTTTTIAGTGDVVFMLAVVAVPLWFIMFGFVFKALRWF